VYLGVLKLSLLRKGQFLSSVFKRVLFPANRFASYAKMALMDY
jgi:hypothetical protein